MLVAVRRRTQARPLGIWKGQVWLAPDWDSPEVNAEIAQLFDPS
jgi:hypothetical protein